MTIEAFYATVSQLSFTLLGFWWAVVQFRHGEWMRDKRYRRMAHTVSFLFLLPGIMALISILASEAKFLWRITFGLAGVLGVVSTILVITTVRAGGNTGTRIILAGQWVAMVLYALVAVVAVRPELVQEDLGIALKPLELEGVFLSLLVVLGVNFAWLLFAEPLTERNTEP